MAVEIDPSYMKHKKGIQKGMFTCFRILSYFIAAVLFYILGFIIVKGISVINWDFLTQAPTDGMTKGGILPAIVGTFYLMIGSAVFSFPVGVMSGIYMNEYAPKGKMVNFIRTMTNNLAGIPSIVFGLFGMAFFVNYLDFGDSIIAGSLTLGLLALPIVIRTTEEAFKDIPNSYREGSLALGATKAQTIWKVLLPMAMPRIITGHWDVYRAKPPPSSLRVPPISCPSCPKASSTNVWRCRITCMSSLPAVPTLRHKRLSPMAQHLF